MSNNQDPIKNANELIERFGGIRPMAAKTGVAVTTIQGWKKRDAIPAARRALIISAAADNGVDLSDLLGGSSAGVANDPLKVTLLKDKKPAAASYDADYNAGDLQKKRL